MDYKHQNLEVPEETARLARKVFKKGNPLIKLRDELGIIYENSEFAELFTHKGRRAEAPGNLALVLILQYMNGLSDEQASECVQARIDWKYLLGLELEDEGFHYDVLQRFRRRIIEGGQEQRLLEHMLEQFKEKGWLKKKNQRTDSTYIVGAVRGLNRLELVGETMRVVLEELAVLVPRWLEKKMPAEWVAKYRFRFESGRLPTKEEEQIELAQEIGADGYNLWQMIQGTQELSLTELSVVEILRQIWLQQYYIAEETIRWRTEAEGLPPAAKQICSPHDIQMRYSQKRDEPWVGYKVHFTETCGDRQSPQLITNVTTTAATVPDCNVTTMIQQELITGELKPDQHWMDQGYVDADNLATSQEQGIKIIGPAPQDTSWQNQNDGFAVDSFVIDWQQKVVTCPQGCLNTTWSESHDTVGNQVIHVRFKRQDCAPCSQRDRCTRSTKYGRSLKLKPKREHVALRLARQQFELQDFRRLYRTRAGVEGTISHVAHHLDARRSRYVGFAKTHLHNLLSALAINLIRIGRWLLHEPRARTRMSPLDTLVFT